MKLVWYIVGAVALYGLVVYLSTLSASDKSQVKETFEENKASEDDIPSLIIKLNETVSALQKVTNGLSKKLLPNTGVTNNNMKAESFYNNDVQKEAEAAAKTANDNMKTEDGHQQTSTAEGASDDEDDSDNEPPAAAVSQQQAIDNKNAVEKFVNGGVYGRKKRRTVETFENKEKQAIATDYRGMESYFTFNASSW